MIMTSPVVSEKQRCG